MKETIKKEKKKRVLITVRPSVDMDAANKAKDSPIYRSKSHLYEKAVVELLNKKE